jgi:predicted nucleotidyltransferase
VQKTVGLAEPLRQALESFQEKINAAFMYGSVAEKGDTAHIDIDLVVLSDELTYGDVFLALRDAGHTLGQEVNPTVPARAEYRGQIAA